MTKRREEIKQAMNTLPHDSVSVFVFDLDNTLIKTDIANNKAYAEAIRIVLCKDVLLNLDKRFTRNSLKTTFPNLSQIQYANIIETKESIFASYIAETVLNKNLLKILKLLNFDGRKNILLTYCHRGRATQLCSHYGISQYFSQQFFYEDCQHNKYALMKALGYDLRSVVLFENDLCAIKEASNNGIKEENIIKVDF